MDDSINRQSALDALDKRFESFIKRFGYDSYERADEKTKLVCDGLSEAENVIMGLPSAQPEIIVCEDCKWRISEKQKTTSLWLPCRALVTPDEFSCIYAERREVTT